MRKIHNTEKVKRNIYNNMRKIHNTEKVKRIIGIYHEQKRKKYIYIYVGVDNKMQLSLKGN
jgi:hypothetical protein